MELMALKVRAQRPNESALFRYTIGGILCQGMICRSASAHEEEADISETSSNSPFRVAPQDKATT